MTFAPLPSYTGQAVIEGVMIRGPNAMAIAMRASDQKIVLHAQPLAPPFNGRFSRTPILRGLLELWDTVDIGWQSLSLSVNETGNEEMKLDGLITWGVLALAVVFGAALFLAPPAVSRWFMTWGSNLWLGSLLGGLVRVMLVIAYVWILGYLPDVRRMWGYHGAEHKVLNAFEAGAEMTPPTVAQFSCEQLRCGVVFLLCVAALIILLFALLTPVPLWPRLVLLLLFIPLLIGFSYEGLHFLSRRLSSPLVRGLALPLLALQRLTVREPDEGMLEVTLSAFSALQEEEKSAEG